MSDLISRQAAIECLEYLSACDEPFMEIGTDDETFIGKYEAIMKISDLPSAQPERKKGKWIEANTHTYGIYECTACKAWSYIPNEPRDYNFCPRCGADMREVDDERPD